MIGLLDEEKKHQLKGFAQTLVSIDRDLIEERNRVQVTVDGLESYSPKLDRVITELKASCVMTELMENVQFNDLTLKQHDLYY